MSIDQSLFTNYCWLVELVNCCVRLGDLILQGRSASLLPCLHISSRRLRLHQSCSVLLCEIFHLYCQQCKRSYRTQSFLLLPVKKMLLLQSVGEFSDSFTSSECITFSYVFKGEQFVMFVTKMSHSKVYGSAICCSSEHHLCHNSWNVYLLLSLVLERIILSWTFLLIFCTIPLLKVLCYSILFLVLFPRTS